ncbi:uncharacterized protein Fot_52248 [Forsythia ovata]|uniref:Uncharacterized protein n=1 Tax=Forsythia ovata TaxID=205694 RepID=A0ABD1PK63_9LAMI
MNCALKISPCSITSLPKVSPSIFYSHNVSWICPEPIYRNHPNVTDSRTFSSPRAMPSSVGDVQRRSSLESLFCYDKPIPEEIIEKPIGLSLIRRVYLGESGNHCQSSVSRLRGNWKYYVFGMWGSRSPWSCLIKRLRPYGGTGNTVCSGCGGSRS